MSNTPTIATEIRGLIGKYGLREVHEALKHEMDELYAYLRSIYEVPKNDIIVPITREVIPEPVTSPRIMGIVQETIDLSPTPFVLEPEVRKEIENQIREVETNTKTNTNANTKEVVIQKQDSVVSKLEGKMDKKQHKEEVAKKRKELEDKGIKPETLLTKENMTEWIDKGYSYLRIARETGVPDNEIGAIAKTFGLQSKISKYIITKNK